MRFVFVSLLLLASPANAFVSAPRTISAPKVQKKTETTLRSFGDLKGIADFFSGGKTTKPVKPKFETVVIEPDFRVAALFLSLGVVLDLVPYLQLTLGPLVTALGVLFLVQTYRIRFIFDDSSLELVTVGYGTDLQSSGENVVVGGANRWKCDSIVNYDFFPKGWIDGPVGPVLVYFKETQTPSDKWGEGPGNAANDAAKIASGQIVAGQVHFFPAVCNGQQIRAEFEKRGCGKR
jgi:hypothetical protein